MKRLVCLAILAALAAAAPAAAGLVCVNGNCRNVPGATGNVHADHDSAGAQLTVFGNSTGLWGYSYDAGENMLRVVSPIGGCTMFGFDDEHVEAGSDCHNHQD